ncbi:MAG: vitamin B12 dependent methionine synthase [bacterium]|nr:vitamin B12 dependent methionine synthase [bacterium]
MEIIKDFTCNVDISELLEQLKIMDSQDVSEFKRILDIAKKIAKPKAIYVEGFIEERGNDFIIVNGVKFVSRTLSKNLADVDRVFPYIATCGAELDSIGFPDDLLKEYWWDSIKAYYLNIARNGLMDYIKTRFSLKKTSTMVPGGGEYGLWPIEQQKELFSLFGDVESLIGVKLTNTYLMMPNKSVSGFLFPTERDYSGCRVCRRKNCPGRSAEFDENLWKALEIEANLQIKK